MDVSTPLLVPYHPVPPFSAGAILYRPAVLQALYRLSDASRCMLQGCTEDMCSTSWVPRGMTVTRPEDLPSELPGL